MERQMRWVVRIEREDDGSESEAIRIECSRALSRPSSSKRRHPRRDRRLIAPRFLPVSINYETLQRWLFPDLPA